MNSNKYLNYILDLIPYIGYIFAAHFFGEPTIFRIEKFILDIVKMTWRSIYVTLVVSNPEFVYLVFLIIPKTIGLEA